jgi:predicted DsbA family dithiol-disulfide isomerase
MTRRPRPRTVAVLVAVAAAVLALAGCRASFLCDREGPTCAEADLPWRGPEAAPIVIEEFSEFQCPFCRRVQATLHELDRRYPDKLRWTFRHYPLPFHEYADASARAAVAALRQDRFWPFHDILFEQGRLAEEDLIAAATKLGLDLQQFRADMDDRGVVAVVARDVRRARDLGIHGVPHFRINGRSVSGAQPLDVFQAVVEEELAKAEALRADGVAPEDIARLLTEQNTAPIPAAPESGL